MKPIVVLALAAGCAVKMPVVLAPPTNPPMPIALMGKFGAAHACPVAGVVVTAGHVAHQVSLVEGNMVYTPLSYMAEDGEGHYGTADAKGYNGYVDLAMLTLSWEPAYYTKGLAVIPGDEVSWVEYDFTRVRKAYQPRIRRAHVVNARLGHIILDETPTPGASGTCVFDALRQVVGVIAFGATTGDGVAGVAVDLSTLP